MDRRRMLAVMLVLPLLAVGLAAFYAYRSLGPSASVPTQGPRPASKAPSAVLVLIPQGAALNTKEPGYSPEVLRVVVGVNNTVIWKNMDSSIHDIVIQSIGLKSPDLYPGDTWNYTFSGAGTYPYVCYYHWWMKGEVIVLPGP